MRFDNAFLTKSGKLGMQFTDNKSVFSAYENEKSVLVVSENATDKQKNAIIAKYNELKGRYTPSRKL